MIYQRAGREMNSGDFNGEQWTCGHVNHGWSHLKFIDHVNRRIRWHNPCTACDHAWRHIELVWSFYQIEPTAADFKSSSADWPQLNLHIFLYCCYRFGPIDSSTECHRIACQNWINSTHAASQTMRKRKLNQSKKGNKFVQMCDVIFQNLNHRPSLTSSRIA